MPTTRANLIRQLLALRGASVCTFTARTDARCRKRGCPLSLPVHKVWTCNGMLNFHYDAGVLRRLAKEGKSPDDFRRGTSWHEPIIIKGQLTALCKHKETAGTYSRVRLYLRFMALNLIGDPTYEDATGQPLIAAVVKPWLPAPTTYANQGLDAPLIFRTIDLDNLTSITFAGATHTVGVPSRTARRTRAA